MKWLQQIVTARQKRKERAKKIAEFRVEFYNLLLNFMEHEIKLLPPNHQNEMYHILLHKIQICRRMNLDLYLYF